MLLPADPGDQGGHAPGPGYLERTGHRLPTSAEWEYACRAGSRTVRPFGNRDELVGEFAWYSDNSARQTHPVGRLKPNAFGLFDMLGNALEWSHESDPHHRGTPAATWRIRARSTAASTATSAAAPTSMGPKESAPIPATRSAPRPSGTTPAAGWCAQSEWFVDAGVSRAHNDPKFPVLAAHDDRDHPARRRTARCR